jgi:hypothetical protein
MRLISTRHVAAALLAAALALPIAASAQTTATPDATTSESRRAQVEQHIADMHATLHITAAQEKAWDTFADVMLGNAQAMDTLLTNNEGKAATQSAEAILQTYADIAQQHAQNVQKLTLAFQALYTSLTAEQKAAADEMFRANAAQRAQKQAG